MDIEEPLPGETVTFPEGTTLGRVRLMRMIGAGGMGTVYLAHHQSLDKTVAVKVLPRRYSANSDYVKRFQREARSAAKLEHPNIIQILDVSNDGDVHFIVMQYYEGMDLQKLITKKGKVSVNDALSIAKKVAQALAAAHKAGIVHRDIKPSNIVITKQGTVLVTDFGLAREIHGTMTASNITQATGGVLLGTPQYVSPEQAMGERSDGRSDIYSLGATLYCMLAGRPPYDDDNPVTVLMKHVRDNEQPEPLRKLVPEVPEALDKIVMKMMAKQPDQRFASMDEIILAIDAFRGTRSTGTVGMAKMTKKRPWMAIAGGALIGMAGMIVLLIVMVTSSASRDFKAAVAAEQAAENDPKKLAEVKALYGEIVTRYPSSNQAGLAKAHIVEIEERMLLIEIGAGRDDIRARYQRGDLTFSAAMRDLRALRQRKNITPELIKSVDDAIEHVSKEGLVRRARRLSDVLKVRDEERLGDFFDPESRGEKDGRTAKVLSAWLPAPGPSAGAWVKSLEPAAGPATIDRASWTGAVTAALVVVTDRGESSFPAVTIRWKLGDDNWYLVH